MRKLNKLYSFSSSDNPNGVGGKETYGSGKKFPIWNSIAGTDKIKSFKLLGYTVQEGMPTPEAPVPLLSVGDEGLKLCISDSETGIALQVVDFGDVVLRSLPNGVCDSIEWDGKQWKYIQRIAHFTADGNSNVSPSLFRENVTSCIYYPNTALGPNFKENSPILCNRKVGKYNYYEPDCIFNTTVTSNYVIITYLNDTGAQYTKEQIAEINAQYPLDFIVELSTPIETVLDLPALQTFDNETWFGTPSALVKPYMMCECKVKKALKYQGDISAWWYFGGNKSNETDRQITDISGNGNDLTPYNFAWTRESGWNQGGIFGDGIDDTLAFSGEIGVKNIILTTSEFKSLPTEGSKYILGAKIDGKTSGLILNAKNFILSSNSNLRSVPNNVPSVPLNYFLLNNTINNKSDGLTLFSYFLASKQFSKGMIHECLLFSSELTDEEFSNNIQLSKQRNGTDGDINIIPEPDVYYDFSLYNNTDFPTTIENLAADKRKILQLFNFAGTEESGFFEGALISDGVDDYAVIQNDAEGFRTVFMEAIPMSAGTMLYNQRIHGYIEEPFAIYLQSNSIAYNARNPGGITYINGVLNESILVQDLLNNKHIITIVNDSLGGTQYLFSGVKGTLSSKAKTFKFIGFKEALTAEQIQEVINQYFSKNLLADFNGDLLTDSEGYFLTSN